MLHCTNYRAVSYMIEEQKALIEIVILHPSSLCYPVRFFEYTNMGSKLDLRGDVIDIRSQNAHKSLASDIKTLKAEVSNLLSGSAGLQSVGDGSEYVEWHRSIPTRKCMVYRSDD